MSSKVVLITGASSGIGEQTAVALAKKGYTVYGAARRIDKLKKLQQYGIKIIQLDVTDENSMLSCVEQIAQEEGRIDILINNAGYGLFGAVEDVSIDEARRQIEVNIFGLARMTQLVLPYMRENRFGRIVNISSMGGRVWTPFGAWYHATKFAVEGFSACLRIEVEPFGIDVVLIEPGGIKTDFGDIASDKLKQVSQGGAYTLSGSAAADAMRKTYSGNLTKPNVIAACIVKALSVKKPKTRYLLGYGAKPAVYVQKWLGDRIYDMIIKKMYNL